jgi:hypothetical protein
MYHHEIPQSIAAIFENRVQTTMRPPSTNLRQSMCGENMFVGVSIPGYQELQIGADPIWSSACPKTGVRVLQESSIVLGGHDINMVRMLESPTNERVCWAL